VSEVTTTLTGFEAKPGENANGTYVLLRFTADDGKKYQTFDEELGERMKARIGQKSVIAFEVQQRNSNGKTFTNNVATDIFEPGSQPAASNGASAGASVAASPVLERVAAFEAGLRLVEVVAPENLNFVSVTAAAENILAWAKGELAGSDPEDIVPEDDSAADAVPN